MKTIQSTDRLNRLPGRISPRRADDLSPATAPCADAGTARPEESLPRNSALSSASSPAPSGRAVWRPILRLPNKERARYDNPLISANPHFSVRLSGADTLWEEGSVLRSGECAVKLLIGSVTSFTFAPIRWMSYLGFVVAFTGFLYAVRVVYVAFTGHPVEGWASLMVVVLIIGGARMLMLGVRGEYLWRALNESRLDLNSSSRTPSA